MNKTIQLLELLRDLKDKKHSFANMNELMECALLLVDTAYDEVSAATVDAESMRDLLTAYERGGAA